MQRMLLEARAFAALKQWDNALDLIAVDQCRRHQAAARRHLLGKRQLGGGRPEDRRAAGRALERCRAADRRRARRGAAHGGGLFAGQ